MKAISRHQRFTAQVSAICLAVLGCGSIAKSCPSPAAANEDACNPLDDFRISAGDHRRVLAWERAWTEQRRAAGRNGLTALSLSGGGANGAFGAGVMVGWTKTGARPVFDVVTGVSTGALIAPFVFAGPAWDARLSAAYSDQRLRALGAGGVGAMIRSGLAAVLPSRLVSAALLRLVAEYADAELLRAIAAEHIGGRRLLVATTHLETRECVIWDLGAIAEASLRSDDDGGSLRLFHNVLVASASVPGFFPPMPIAWDRAGRRSVELHVDGAVTTPFFLAPGSMSWRSGSVARPAELYVVINGNLDPTYRTTRRGEFHLDSIGPHNAEARAAAEILAERHGAVMTYAAIPDDRPADPFNFRPDNLNALFEFGQAAGGRAFGSTVPPLGGLRPVKARAA